MGRNEIKNQKRAEVFLKKEEEENESSKEMK